MRGAKRPLPNTPLWHGAQLKHTDNFTSTIYHRLYLYCVTSTQV